MIIIEKNINELINKTCVSNANYKKRGEKYTKTKETTSNNNKRRETFFFNFQHFFITFEIHINEAKRKTHITLNIRLSEEKTWIYKISLSTSDCSELILK
jgi:hypothetical protein